MCAILWELHSILRICVHSLFHSSQALSGVKFLLSLTASIKRQEGKNLFLRVYLDCGLFALFQFRE